MTIKRTLIIALLWFSQFVFSQFNDTLFYQSGNFKVVEIIDKSKKELTYQFINEKGDITRATASIGAYYFVYGNNFHHFPIPSLDVGIIKTFGKTRRIPLGDYKMQ
jgi:hypothetical protein